MRLLILLFMTLLGGQLVASHTFEIGDLPAPPDRGVYDPDEWLMAEARIEIEQSIARAKSKWMTQVFLVVFPERPEAEGETLARTIAEGWGAGKLWGVAIYVVGDPEFPAFYSGRKDSFGWSAQQESKFTDDLSKALADVRGRAMREGDARLQIQTGMRELSDEIGYLGIMMARIDRGYNKVRGDHIDNYRKKQSDTRFVKRLLMVLVPLVLLLAVFVVFLLRRKKKETRSDFYFPETSPRRRFHAPWSGGGDVIVKFGSRVSEDGSRKG